MTTWVSRYHKGKTCLSLNEAWDHGVWGCSGISWTIIMQTVCTSLQTDNHNNTPSLNFCRPGALPDARPTVSKHWNNLPSNTNFSFPRAFTRFTLRVDFSYCLKRYWLINSFVCFQNISFKFFVSCILCSDKRTDTGPWLVARVHSIAR